MSSRFSPDGMYYWNGEQWVSTLSPDGRYRWDGSSWVPAVYAPMQFATQPAVRRPTSWTRPVQYAVIAWYGISALSSLSLPLWMGGQMSQIVRAAMQQQQAQNPNLQPPPQSFYDSMTAIMTGVLWIAALFGVAIAAVLILGAIRRWVWSFYVVLVLLGLGLVSGPANLIRFSAPGSFSTSGYALPSSLIAFSIVSWILSSALFVFMLIVLIRRGPWGMVKVSAGESPAA